MRRIITYRTDRQMSESFVTATFLSLSGGLQDAYTYMFRGHVFANGQTGNVVLLSQAVYEQNWLVALHYLMPLIAFACGVGVTEHLKRHYKNARSMHWRQLVVLGEMALLFFVGLLPNSLDILGNSLVSFACAMQIEAFRKVDGYAFASTMCVGDLRSGMESLYTYHATHNDGARKKAVRYFGIIVIFAIGAALGSELVSLFGAHAIWASCVLLFVAFSLMFIREEIDEHPEILADEEALLVDLHELGDAVSEAVHDLEHQVVDELHVIEHELHLDELLHHEHVDESTSNAESPTTLSDDADGVSSTSTDATANASSEAAPEVIGASAASKCELGYKQEGGDTQPATDHDKGEHE